MAKKQASKTPWWTSVIFVTWTLWCTCFFSNYCWIIWHEFEFVYMYVCVYILIQCLALSAKIEQKNITVKIYTWEISFIQITLLIISEAVKHVYYWVSSVIIVGLFDMNLNLCICMCVYNWPRNLYDLSRQKKMYHKRRTSHEWLIL
jgi:hypothetical protein